MNTFTQIVLQRKQDVLFASLNRPDTRNAMGPEMVGELARVLEMVDVDSSVRALVLRGSQGIFCAGGNLGSFQARLSNHDEDDSVAAYNRKFGYFMQAMAGAAVPVVVVVEGAAIGGGMGLACVADIVIARQDARFALTETSLGIIPAQILPFVMARIGQATTRRLGLTSERINGDEAHRIGLVDHVASDQAGLNQLLAQCLSHIGRCAPDANRELKKLIRNPGHSTEAEMLDVAAQRFSACMRNEGDEGIAAFRERRAPAWAVTFAADDLQATFDDIK
ncbi:enoyl-CoA hydratase/isomerase family protein [Alcaligenaceae bacterium]|nr:enoyl-CoA hydratase/isomerase family protein [Alcaligenaceae bacterium]